MTTHFLSELAKAAVDEYALRPRLGGGRVTLVHAATPYKRFSALLVFSTTLSREPRPTGRDAARTGA